jgi:glycine/D-amino acid oxidase-like deaminating enzyme
MALIEDADVAVVGGGIIGVATALALQDRGLSVLVIEENEPGMGTAAGSGGFLHDGEIFPIAQPALLAELPRLLFDPSGPLVFRLAYLPHIAGWGVKFLRSMRRTAVTNAINALASLNRLAIDSLYVMATTANAEALLVRRGGLKVAHDPHTLEALTRELAQLDQQHIAARTMDSTELHALEPALAPDIAGAVYFPNSAHCVDLTQFGDRLAARVRERGTIVRGRVTSLSPKSSGGWQADFQETDSTDSVHARRVVVSAGYGSGALLRKLGYTVPLAPARGYHLTIADPGVLLSHPVILHEPHFGATPMNAGLRLAGTMEFASPTAAPDYKRAEMLYGIARRYFPGLRNGNATKWMGIRPSMPDSLPCIGRASRHEDLYYCFGHGHLGLTQAAISARCIADLIVGQKPAIELTPFDLSRFT